MDQAEEKKLIERAKKDPEALGQIFEKYYSPLLNYILKRTGILGIAQDIISEVFLIVVRKLWQFQWRNIPFSAWLYRIANNEIAYYFRKNKYKTISLEVILEEENNEPVDPCNIEEEYKENERMIETHQEFLEIHKLLLELPLKYQEVLTLKYFDDKKIREISVILGKNDNTVKSLLKRGLSLLQEKAERVKIKQQFPIFIISEDETS